MKLRDYGNYVCYKHNDPVNGFIQYLKHGVRHRDGGPAVVYQDNSYYEYCKDGQYHRTNGPARAWRNSWAIGWNVEYYILGKKLSRQEYLELGYTECD